MLTIRDQGILSSVKMPLLALGRLLQNCWGIKFFMDKSSLCRDGRYFLVKYRGNSFAFNAETQIDPVLEYEEDSIYHRVHILEVESMDLSRLREEWQPTFEISAKEPSGRTALRCSRSWTGACGS